MTKQVHAGRNLGVAKVTYLQQGRNTISTVMIQKQIFQLQITIGNTLQAVLVVRRHSRHLHRRAAAWQALPKILILPGTLVVGTAAR